MASQTITVSSSAELNQALANATGGETILLAAGDYGRLDLKNAQYASNVTIKSADPNAMASFSEAYVNGSSNITFDTVLFDYTYSSGNADYASRFRVDNSSNITFTNSIFDGDMANGAGTGKGLVVQGSTNVDVINTEFHTWWKAMNIGTSSDIDLIGNNIHTIRSDGINLGRVDDVLIENNYIHDFGGLAGSGDHRDMIQIQRSSGDGSSNITIRNNVLDMGAGDYTQAIWAGGDKANASDPTDWHQNIVIEGNIIYNAHTNGIALYMTDGLTISENTLLAVPRAKTGGVTIPKIIVDPSAKNVTIEQNVTSAISGHSGQADWNVQDNAFVQNTDPTGPGYYDTQFIYHATSQADGYNQFGVKSGSTVDILNAGSSLVDNYPFSYDTWVGTATSNVSNTGGTGSTGTTDPSDTSSGGTTTGTTDPSDTSAGDTSTDTTDPTDTSTGNTGTDTTDPTDTSAGDTGTDTTDPTDTSTGNTGTDTTDTTDTSSGNTGTGTQSPMVFDDFVLDIAGLPDNEQAELRGDATIVDTAAGPAIRFDGDRDMANLGRLTQFEDSQQIAFTVDFTRDEADGSTQRLVWNKGHLGLTLTQDGLVAHVANNDSKFTKGFRADNIGLNDTETHTITLMVDEVADRLQVVVDGAVVIDETDTDFDFVDAHGGLQWGWNLGFKWNRNVDGDVSAFAIDDDVQFMDHTGVQDDLFA